MGGSGPFAESVITRYRKLRAQQPGLAGITPALLKVGQEWTAPYYVERRDGYRGEQHPHYVVCHTAADTVPEEIWVLRGEHRELDAVRLSAVFCEQWRRAQRPEERRGSDVPPLNAPVLPHSPWRQPFATRDELGTLEYVLEFGGEGEQAAVVRTYLSGGARYWMMTRHYRDDLDDPDAFVVTGTGMTFLGTDAADALRSTPYPWADLVGLYVAPVVTTVLAGRGRTLDHWMHGELNQEAWR